MSEAAISISNLNDFIFCPVSIYFHSLDKETDNLSMQDEYQINGSASHQKVDTSTYSSKRTVYQSISVYCEQYNLYGKIDIFDSEKGLLTERKKKIICVYDGYVFQLYAQYFALTEMGYKVEQIRLYSMEDNKVYPIALPKDDEQMFAKFKKLIHEIQNFHFEGFMQTNPSKCEHCIYEPLCTYSCAK